MIDINNITIDRLKVEVVKDYLSTIKKSDDITPAEITSNIIQLQNNLITKRNYYVNDNGEKKKRADAWSYAHTLTPTQISLILVSLYHIKLIMSTENMITSDDCYLAIYNDSGKNEGVYTQSDDVFWSLALQFNADITEKEYKLMLKSLRAYAEIAPLCKNKDLICVGNGILNYKTKEVMDYNPDIVFVSKIATNYNPNATNPIIINPDNTKWDVETWFESLSDNEEIVNFLWLLVGVVLRPTVDWNKSFWFYAENGNNGKGTLCSLLRNLCGLGNHTSIPLNRFSDDNMLLPLMNVSAVITDENDVGIYVDKCANLKALITGDTISINRKYKDAVSFVFNGVMIQCINEYPRLKDTSDSMLRRLVIIPFDNCFTGKENKLIKSDYLKRQDVLEYVLYKVINFPSYYDLDIPEVLTEELKTYKTYNDTVDEFWEEFKDEFVWDILPFTFLYDLYTAWYKKYSPEGKILSNKKFINQLINITNKNDEDFICEDKDKRYRVLDKMNKSEPLIIDFNLSDWKNDLVKTNDKIKLSTVTNDKLNKRYRGLVKKD